MQSTRQIVFLVSPQLVLLDFAGPWSVFHTANALSTGRKLPYALELATTVRTSKLQTWCGLTLGTPRHASAFKSAIHTLIVPASMTGPKIPRSSVHWLQKLAKRSQRIVSVCGGAFVLGEAGLLRGRRATTHWRACDEFAKRFPETRVEPDAIYVKDGPVYTSAGVTAGMDLALALVEEDLGREMALTIARNLVLFVRRPGGQTQYSAMLQSQACEQKTIQSVIAWAQEHPAADLCVESLAARAHMSVRNFSRVFRKEIRQPPAKFIERLRLDQARHQFEDTEASLSTIASRTGFGTYDAMRRSFLRVLRISPGTYRERFKFVD